MMDRQKTDTVLINATIEVPAESLQIVVETARQMTGRNQKGHYQVDTAELLNRLLTRFVVAKDFVGFVSDRGNYE